MERVFGAPQQHLPPLLRLNGITTMAANRYLVQTYLPEHNARFAVAAAEAGSAFGPFVGALDDILCIKEERVVSRDNCVRYNNRILQITEQVHRHHYVKATVQCPRIPGRWPGRLPRPALPGALPPHGRACFPVEAAA